MGPSAVSFPCGIPKQGLLPTVRGLGPRPGPGPCRSHDRSRHAAVRQAVLQATPRDLTNGDTLEAARITRLGRPTSAVWSPAEAGNAPPGRRPGRAWGRLLFGVPTGLASRWIAPVLGVSGFTPWLAYRDGRDLAVATTVASVGDAGPAVVLTGLGSLAGAGPRLTAAQARAAIRATIERDPAAMIHTHGDRRRRRTLRTARLHRVDELQVRLLNDA
jgi:hypothetical protein